MMIEVSRSAYSVTALQKAAYVFAAELVVIIKEGGENFILELSPADNFTGEPDIAGFIRCANDYALRERLAAQTAPLRNLILAHAYSKTQFVSR
jgi:His-Xaa-Ser system protein HxsD